MRPAAGHSCTRPRHPAVALLFAGLLVAQAAAADFDQAVAAFDKGDYATAIREVKPLAEKGDPRSQYAMGVMAENGFGMRKDLGQAAAWYRKAAEQGNADAQFNLGAMYEHGVGMPVNYAQAARWYRPAAEEGDIDALSNLGVLYEKGLGVKKNPVLALALYNVSVAYDSDKYGTAAKNRQGLANRMPLADVQKALQLTNALLAPGALKPRLQAAWKDQSL
jgi:TPR repeat protein